MSENTVRAQAGAPEAPVIELTIDGKPCTCTKGEYLYDVALRNGVFIPTLCRADPFPEHRAACRVCIVEVETRGRSKTVTACVYPVEEPCTVRTQSPKIREERAVIMGLLAARAPASQRIGQMARFMGAGEGFERLVRLDGKKCILCGLCVQACDSLGTGAISTVLRGCEKQVETPYAQPAAACIGCASCARVCPTEAIELVEDEAAGTRTIWHQTFELARCERCGATVGTRAMVERARAVAGPQAEKPADGCLCDACRKQARADEMMATYRNV